MNDPRNNQQKLDDKMRNMQIKRLRNCISKRVRNGERVQTSKALAKMWDNVYGTDTLDRYHK